MNTGAQLKVYEVFLKHLPVHLINQWDDLEHSRDGFCRAILNPNEIRAILFQIIPDLKQLKVAPKQISVYPIRYAIHPKHTEPVLKRIKFNLNRIRIKQNETEMYLNQSNDAPNRFRYHQMAIYPTSNIP